MTITLRAFNEMLPDEDAARAWFERSRWLHESECYHCGAVGSAAYMPKTKFWHCKSCKKQFSVTAGTPMHRTHLPLLTWAHAIYLIVSSSKGISAVKLGEMLGISYPSAWYLGHRVRAMVAEANPILFGVVEIDEMYAGAPTRKQAKSSRDHDDDDGPPANRKGRGTKRPSPRHWMTFSMTPPR